MVGDALLLLLLCCAGCVHCLGSGFAGPYRFEVLELHTCPNDTEYGSMEDGDWTMDGHIRHNMTIHERVWDGVITLKNKAGYPRHSRTTWDFAKWDTVSGWREHYLVLPLGDFCFALDVHYPELFQHLSKHIAGLPPKCPLPDVKVRVSNVPARLPPIRKFPILPYGRFKAHILGFPWRSTKVKVCIMMVVDILPALPKRDHGGH